MSYTPDERLSIGEKVYKQEMTKLEAMEKYGIGHASIENYVRAYKESHGIPVRTNKPKASLSEMQPVTSKTSSVTEMDEYMSMSKEELIRELIIAKANELRAKKGYEVKGAGANKEFIPLNNKNSKS